MAIELFNTFRYKFLVMGERPRIGESQDKLSAFNPIRYRYQRSNEYQVFVNEGMASELSTSGFCWLACLDMLSSIHLPNDKVRMETMLKIARAVNENRMLMENGGIKFYDFAWDYVDIIDHYFSESNIPVEPDLALLQSEKDIVKILLEGNMLIVSTANIGEDNLQEHMIFMDQLFFYDGGKECMIRYWDPLNPNSNLINIKQQPFALGGKPRNISALSLVFRKKSYGGSNTSISDTGSE